MIGRVTGRLLAQEDEDTLVVDVSGVGYELHAPLGTAGRAAHDHEGLHTFFVHTHVREDQITLFGFATEPDRTAFRTLIGVSNVGPKTALALLSALPAPELGRAIAAKDMARLTSISGVGKKTAERLLLELRDKLSDVALPAEAPSRDQAAREAPASSKSELLLGALTRLGYRSSEAERAIAALGGRVAEVELSDLLREALVLLAK